jgi:Spy/CpxP family protein refolding chaperone
MKSRTIIIILSSVIVIQMIAGVFILRREYIQGPPLPPFGFMEERMGIEPGKRHMRGNRLGGSFCEPGFMRDKLSLNQDQTDRINDLNKKFDTEFTGYIKLIDPERQKLKDMLDSNTSDMREVREQLKKIGDLNIEIHMLRIKQGKEISGILTPEQMNTLRNERKMMFERMQKNHGGMMR